MQDSLTPQMQVDLVRFIEASGESDHIDAKGPMSWDGAVGAAALAKDIALTIHPHPTLSETVMESAEVYFGTSTHVYRPKR